MTKVGHLISIENHHHLGGQATLAEPANVSSVCFPLKADIRKQSRRTGNFPSLKKKLILIILSNSLESYIISYELRYN